jgi:hypothetical protein
MNREASLSVIDLLNKQFGITPDYHFTDPNPNVAGHNTKRANGGSPLYGIDAYGRDYFMPITIFTPAEQLPFGGTGAIVASIAKQTITLPYGVIRVMRSKRFIDTPLTERAGDVTELININDPMFRIRGILFDKNRQWPEDQLQMLENLFRAQTPVIMRSALSDIYLSTPERNGSYQVTIRNMEIPEGRGGINVRFYDMEVKGDMPFSLEEV